MDEEHSQIQKAQLARTAPTTRVDVLVIGAGQAGLATGYRLAQEEVSFLIVDEDQQIGDSWRKRYDSLTLFTATADFLELGRRWMNLTLSCKDF